MWRRAFLCLCLLFGCGVLASPAAASTLTANCADYVASPRLVIEELDRQRPVLPQSSVGLIAVTHAVVADELGEVPGLQPMGGVVSMQVVDDGELGQQPGIAPADDAGLFASAHVVDEGELGQQRGGFVVDGLNINLGAQIQTFVNGELALMTTVSWTDSLVKNTQVMSGALVPASAAQLHDGLLKAGNITINVGDSAVYLANDGRTALIHRTDTGIENILINTANNTNIRTQVNATIDVSGYGGFQATMQNGSLVNSLGIAVGAAAIGVVTH